MSNQFSTMNVVDSGEGHNECFLVFFSGSRVTIDWKDGTEELMHKCSPVVQFCSITSSLFLILTENGCLYQGKFDSKNLILQIFYIRPAIDVQYCSLLQQIFVVDKCGVVFTRNLNENSSLNDNENSWKVVIFDPLEICENGVKIRKICCSNAGCIFVSLNDDIYVLGHFNHSKFEQPKCIKIFKLPTVVLDVAAGDNFFIFLTRKKIVSGMERPATGGLLPDLIMTDDIKCESNRNTYTAIQNSLMESRNSDDIEYQHDFLNSLISRGEHLIETEVYTFGSVNKGLLGTGDHINREGPFAIKKLKNIGVCSIATGREHSVVRTIDGRLYHWGLNSNLQLTKDESISDISSPTELCFDSSDLDISRNSILEACCGDYRTVLLSSHGKIYENNQHISSIQEKSFLTVQMKDFCWPQRSYALLLSCDKLTIYNLRNFKHKYMRLLNNLQQLMRTMIDYRNRYRQLVEKVFKELDAVWKQWENILYLGVAILHSIEGYYRADYEDAQEIVILKYYTECIQIFENYSKAYCDTYSIDGFAAANQVLAQQSKIDNASTKYNLDLMKMFQLPFQIFPHIIQLIEKLQKTGDNNILDFWNKFSRYNRIDLELAENTRDFWRSNTKSSKILKFKQRDRRVILSSNVIPMKLAHSMGLNTPIFILFSDCLCQVIKNHINAFPLTAMWPSKENLCDIRVITPEKTFVLTTRNDHDRELWFDQLDCTIKQALHLPETVTTLPELRLIEYSFSSNHSTYKSTYAKGYFLNGVLHGKCRLEFPFGKLYIGEIVRGNIEGYGRMFCPKSGLYRGSFKAGKYCGFGTLIINEKEFYEGYFQNGLYHGYGHLQLNDSVYLGDFVENEKCGYGVLDYTSPAGEKYMGMFADSKRSGAGIVLTSLEGYFEGVFSNDQLTGKSIAVFPNSFYYEGEMSLRGPTGTGRYYMPTARSPAEVHDFNNCDRDGAEANGNILSGQLSGTWDCLRINGGSMEMNCTFAKTPKSVGSYVATCENKKWQSLFDCFEMELFGDLLANNDTTESLLLARWNCIIEFIEKQKYIEIEEKTCAASDSDVNFSSIDDCFNRSNSNASNWNILNFNEIASNFDKLSLNSSLFGYEKSQVSNRHSVSQESLNTSGIFSKFDLLEKFTKLTDVSTSTGVEDIINQSYPQAKTSWNVLNDSSISQIDDGASATTDMDIIPQFINVLDLNNHNLLLIRRYLDEAFHYTYHPLKRLNDRLTRCFYRSYGCWKGKPTPLLAKQAIEEWESISKRIYGLVRKLFPALPEEFCVIGENRDVLSHITLLYPILLTEGIYSTIFVLYANKYSQKDEIYRQNLLHAQKLQNEELIKMLDLDSSLNSVIASSSFLLAVNILKEELQEKLNPTAMLTIIEKCIEQITCAYQIVSSPNQSLNADVIMPLCLVLLLRAGIPHLGAELNVLNDLTDSKSFELEMNGIRGYCYTTLKASYEHIARKSLFETNRLY